MTDKQIFSAVEAAQEIGVCGRTIDRMAQEFNLGSRPSQKKTYYTIAEVEFMRAHKRPPGRSPGLSAAQRRKMLELRDKGISGRQIAIRIKAHVTTVNYNLRKLREANGQKTAAGKKS
jgi:hypothetical protein